MPNIKTSYGIICYKKTTGVPIEFLFIQKIYTYAFCDFVMGKYKKGHDKNLVRMFNSMTYSEKIDILSLKFENLWYKIYNTNPDTYIINNSEWLNIYIKRKAKFENTFLRDSGHYLRKLITGTNNVDLSWEFPKGRKEKKETEIETSLREFKEETGLGVENITIKRLKPFIESYMDCGTIYRNIYLVCEFLNGVPNDKFKLHSETSNIKWFNLNEIKFMYKYFCNYEKTIQLMQKLKKIIKKM